MEMCYDGILTMPIKYVVVNDNEMEYVEGGIATATVVSLCIAAVGAGYAGGQAIGERVYYSGYTNTQYQKDKWYIRAAVIRLGGILGGVFMLGFENKFYSLVRQ